MAYYHENRDQSRRYDPYGYSRHANPSSSSSQGYLTGMSNSANQSGYSQYSSSPPSSYGSYDPRYAASYAAPPPLPRRSAAQPAYRSSARSRRAWPPSPSAEDEKTSLKREVSAGGGAAEDEFGDEAIARGTVDQYPIIQEIERPETTDDRRFVLVSDPVADADAKYAAREWRRKRGNMHPIETGADDPPLFTERIPTPYAYTKPQKESLAPSAGDYALSPEPITPNTSAVPRSVPNRDAWDSQRDQNARPPRQVPIHSRYDSAQPSRTPKQDVFEDTDTDDDNHDNYLRTDRERKPARYSFVKSDLAKDDLRTNLRDHQAKFDKRPSDNPASRSGQYDGHHSGSSGSSKVHTPSAESPRSSSSSVNNGFSSRRREQPAPVESRDSKPAHFSEARPSRPQSPLRPSSPLHQGHLPSPPQSPKPQQRQGQYEYPPSPRPSSRAGSPRVSSPLSSQVPPPVPPRVPVTEADWHSTYPPMTSNDRPSRFSRHETMPIPAPRIDIKSPSPARQPKSENSLPYPTDDIPTNFFMPKEEVYQFDHTSTPTSPAPNLRSPYSESPRHSQPTIPASPRDRPAYTFPGPSIASRYTANPEELESPRPSPVRPSGSRPQPSNDKRRTERTLNLDRPMPSCPRNSPSSERDWFTLDGCEQFDICPSCYEGVFADTPFSDYFTPIRRYEERFCDFSSPWMRLAWLLTIKQNRKDPDLLYQLATVAEITPHCPKDREISGITWYGIPDQRDGIHVSNFAICPCDFKMVEALCPRIRGYLTPLPSTDHYGMPQGKHVCALRTTSKRFPKYLDLLVELDTEAHLTNQRPDINRFIKLAREHAYKGECQRDKALIRKPWFFIPSLPEFTVCEECFDEVVYPAVRNGNGLAKMFNRRTQLVPGEDEELGTSCCLYSPRMRKVWERAVEDADFEFLRRKAEKRKRDERRLGLERKGLERWMADMEASGGYGERDRDVDRVRRDLRAVEQEWEVLE